MLTSELIHNQIPQLNLDDTVASALAYINDFKVSHLPVVESDKYAGLIAETDLLDADNENNKIATLQKDFIHISVKEKDHFLQAVNICNQFQTNVVPVVNVDGELLGTITSTDLLQAIGQFSGAQEQGAILILEMERIQFAISEISRIVESNDATILHLNTSTNVENGLLTVTLQLNKKELSAIVATFERYEYNVIYYFGEERFQNDIQNNYENLMNYLEI
ncbi:MAG: hypothetical protein NVSMB45_02740 [Ginsengibacter sp.]